MVVSELLAVVGIEFDEDSVNEAEGAFGKLGTAVKQFAAIFAVGALLDGMRDFVNEIVDVSSEISNLSARAGTSRAELQRLSAVTGTLGLEMEATAKSMEDTHRLFAQVADGTAGEELQNFFRDTGVEARDSAGNIKVGQEALLSFLDGVATLDNAAERTQALSLVSEELRRFAPLVANGENRLRGLIEEMGGFEGLTDDVVDSAGELEMEMAVLDFGMMSFKNMLAKEVLPVITKFVAGAVKLTRSFIEFTKNSHIMEAALIALGATMAIVALATIELWGPPVLIFLAIAAAVVGLTLLVEDFLVFMEGGESVIGDFLDSLFGIGTAERVVQSLKDAWASLTSGIAAGVEFVSLLFGDLVAMFTGGKSAISDLIDEIFGVGTAKDTVDGITAAFLWLKTTVTDIVNGTMALFSSVIDRIGESRFFQTIAAGFNSVRDRMRATSAAREEDAAAAREQAEASQQAALAATEEAQARQRARRTRAGRRRFRDTEESDRRMLSLTRPDQQLTRTARPAQVTAPAAAPSRREINANNTANTTINVHGMSDAAAVARMRREAEAVVGQQLAGVVENLAEAAGQ